MRTKVLSKIQLQKEELANQFGENECNRLAEMAQTLVQLIVRNLYERTADVRWWATDEAFYRCLENITPETCTHANKRLSIINRFYSVYLDLVLVNPNGEIVAASQGDKYRNAIGGNVRHQRWFQQAMNTHSGDEYVVDDIFNDAIHNGQPVAIYATAVRKGGEIHGEVKGVIGVYFDWGEQSRCIVQDEPNLSAEEWGRTKVLLLDGNSRIIASSDGLNLLSPFHLHNEGRTKGYYIDEDGSITAFARTIGYQEYEGLGWQGVVIQRPAATGK